MTTILEHAPVVTEPHPNLPSGYAHVEQLDDRWQVTSDILPWVDEPQELGIAECTLQSGETFYLASAVGTSPKLAKAAENMNVRQRQNADNMFYSRLPEYIQRGHAPNIEVIPKSATEFPIRVMRNKGGQRVYFGLTHLRAPDGSQKPVVLRLGVCDKNRQSLVMSVISNATAYENRAKTSK